MKIICLTFNSPLHIHGSREDYAETKDRVHSDTLYSAILSAWAMMGFEEPLSQIGNSDNMEGNLDFTCSSLFPFFKEKEGDYTFFLPRPQKPFETESVRRLREAHHVKAIKKIEWLDLAYFTEHCKAPFGTKISEGSLWGKYMTSAPSSFAKYAQKQRDKGRDTDFMQTQLTQHANIPRTMGGEATTMPYVVERIHFREGCGLYFIFEGSDEKYQLLLKALSLLEEEGIGTDRSTGNGRFTCHVLEAAPILHQFKALFEGESEHRTNLSLFCPESHEQICAFLETPKAGYGLIKRGGWISSEPFIGLQKRDLYMFSEGSIFKTPHERIAGAVVNVKPLFDTGPVASMHPIWRSGRSFFVPVQFPLPLNT